MKKMLFVFAICAMCVSTFAATEWPGWKCTDLQKLEAAKQGFIAEKNTWKVLQVDVLIELAKKIPTSFIDIENAIEKLQKPEKWTNEQFDKMKMELKKQFPICRNEFQLEAWEFCKKNPSDFNYYYVRNLHKKFNLTDEFVYNFMIDFINEYPNHIAVSGALKIALDKSIKIDSNKVKADLQVLNRIFSRKLLQDKAKWEPIVAEIRTVLETY